MPVRDHESEEYLEAILKEAGKDGLAKTTDIARDLGVAPASVTEQIKRLAKRGLVEHTPYHGVRLTQEGRCAAEKLVRKHRLLERFLHDRLHIKKDGVHPQACEMEHTLSDEADRALCRMLEGPDTCPHGRVIPPCDADVPSCAECLRKSEEEFAALRKRDGQMVPLTEMPNGRSAVVAFIRGGSAVVRRLCDMGFVPGERVTVERAAPMKGPLSVRVKGCSLMLGRGIAGKIYVRPG